MAHRYLAFNKPYDVLSQFSGEGRRTLKEFIDVAAVYPVGRLDRDSEGLMLLTSDGELQHRLTDPKFAHPRTYWAQVEGIPSTDAIVKLERGVPIQDYVTLPARARLLSADPPVPPRDPPIRFRKSIPTSWIELTLAEGRNRQVRRMTAAVGYPTLRLIRAAIGTLHIDNLAPGQWRDLTPNEVRALKPVSTRYHGLQRRNAK